MAGNPKHACHCICLLQSNLLWLKEIPICIHPTLPWRSSLKLPPASLHQMYVKSFSLMSLSNRNCITANRHVLMIALPSFRNWQKHPFKYKQEGKKHFYWIMRNLRKCRAAPLPISSVIIVLGVGVRLEWCWKSYTTWELNSKAQTKHDDNAELCWSHNMM